LDRRVTKGKAGRLKGQPKHRRGQLGLLWNRGLSPIRFSGSLLFQRESNAIVDL
jgi:hypothetical protein